MPRRKIERVDGFYTAARKILDTPARKQRRGIKIISKNRIPTPPPPKTEFVYEGVGCMKCNEVTSIATSVRGRMLKGLVQQEIEGGTIDPTTGRGIVMTRVFPTYTTGRVCGKCMKSLRMILEPYKRADGTYSTTPIRKDEVEVLQERVTPRFQRVITKGLMEMEDEAERDIEEKEAVKYEHHKSGVRLKVSPPPTPDEEIDIKGYRRYGLASRGGIKNYDKEVNFDNIRKERGAEDKRWFKRG